MILPPPVDNIFRKIFYDLAKILGKVGKNMMTPPPPPNVDGFATSLLRGERQVRSPLRHRKSQIGKLSPQAYVPYNYSLAPEPCYFQQGVYNSFCDK